MSNEIEFLSISLKDFGRHESLKIDFASSLTVLKGANGSGKSTVLQSIYFALFGVSAVDGSSKDLPRIGTTDCYVSLRLRIDESSYTIIRTTKTATVRDGAAQSVICSGQSVVSQWVQDKLGVSQKSFLALTYAAQTETAAIMSIGAAALNKTVETIAEADLIAAIERKSSELAGQASFALGGLEQPEPLLPLLELASTTELSLKTMAEHHAELEKEREVLEALHRNTSKVFNEAKERAKAREESLNALAKANEKLGILRALIINDETALKAISVSEDRINALSSEKEELKKTCRSMREAQAKERAIKRELDSLLEWNSGTPDWPSVKAEISEKLEVVKSDYEQQAAQLLEASGPYNKDKEDHAVVAKKLAGAVCDSCGRPFDADDMERLEVEEIEIRNRLELSRNLFELRNSALKETALRLNELNKKLPTEVQLYSYATNRNRLNELLAQSAEHDTDLRLKEAEEAFQACSNSLANALSDRRTVRATLERLEENRTSEKELLDQSAELSDRFSGLPEVDLLELATKKETSGAAVMELKAKLAEAKKELQLLGGAAEDIARRIDRSKRTSDKRAGLEKRKSDFESLTKFLRQNRANFMSELWAQIMSLTSEFVRDVTDSRIAEIGRSDAGEFWYKENDREMPYSRLAGGFKAIAGVGLRLAMASLLPAGVSVLVLDEPSAELSDSMAASLAGALRAQGRQIVMVTHRSGEEYSADCTIDLEV